MKPYRMQRLGILNHVGGVWTPETFDNRDAALAYIARAQKQNPTWDLSNHSVAPVRVTVTPVKPPKALRDHPLKGSGETTLRSVPTEQDHKPAPQVEP